MGFRGRRFIHAQGVLKSGLVTGLTVVVIALSIQGGALRTEAGGPCDVTGPFTDTLCPTEGLQPNEYLTDSGERYRLYFENSGNTVVYDTSTNPWTTVYTMWPHGTIESPDELVYSPIHFQMWISEISLPTTCSTSTNTTSMSLL